MPGIYDDDEDYGESTGPKALREALEKAKADLKARDAKIADLEKSNVDLAGKLKTTTLRDALSDAKVDPKYARFAERDGVEPDVESVKKWVEENKDVYAFLSAKAEPAANADEPSDGDEGGPEDVLPADFVAQILAGQQAETTGRPGGSATVTDVLSGVDVTKFKNERELDEFLSKLGAPAVGG